MPDANVRELGRIEDFDGRTVVVGVDYDTVTLDHPTAPGFRLNRAQCEEFAKAFVAACWEAADNARLMAEGDT